MRQGFTTVELLVTLFIASMMVVSGYQLYSAVTLRSARERAMSEASSIAYSRLRELSDYTSTITTSCGTSHTAGSTSTTYLSSTSTLPGSPRVVVYRCRPFSDNPVLRVTAVVTYDSPVREVVHATYVTP